MNTRVLIGIISFSVALTGVFVANLFLYMMIGEINRKRSDGNLVSYFGFTYPKMVRIFDEYRRSYPKGRLHLYAWIAFGLGVICLIITAFCAVSLGMVAQP